MLLIVVRSPCYQSRQHILRYWSGVPDQHRGTNRPYRRMRIGAAAREIARDKGARSPSPGYDYVTRDTWLCRFHYCALSAGVYLWYKARDTL